MRHKLCRDRYVNETESRLPTAFRRQHVSIQSADEAEMVVKFNTAYFIAKEELSFTKFKSELELLKKNGVKLNPTYCNDTACAQFIGAIADTLKQKTSELSTHQRRVERACEWAPERDRQTLSSVLQTSLCRPGLLRQYQADRSSRAGLWHGTLASVRIRYTHTHTDSMQAHVSPYLGRDASSQEVGSMRRQSLWRERERQETERERKRRTARERERERENM